ncbi:MAG TPA: helix-turn-helix domain-containing protein [Terriglobales bacterium]
MADDRKIDYQSLAEFRYQIRRFLHFSEGAARAAGIEPQHHQVLLTIKGLPPAMRPTIRTLAERMQLQHHSTVELIDRLEKAGLVHRHRGEQDRREVLIELSLHHQDELRNSGPALAQTLRRLMTRPPATIKTHQMSGASRRSHIKGEK